MFNDWPYAAEVVFWFVVLNLGGWTLGLGLYQVEMSRRRRERT